MHVEKIKLPFKVNEPILALGGQAKNRLCFAKDNFAYLSQMHADLSNLNDFLDFEKDAKYFLKQKPGIIACDMHPEYQSTKYALNLTPNTYHLQPTQHHHAHIAACMVENGMRNQKVIGVAFDGTGFGLNNELWGGEFFICDYKNFTRKAHLKEIPLVGGEGAVLEPARLTAMWLYLIYGEKFLRFEIDFVNKLDKKRWGVLKKIYQSGVNSPMASSMGRLFDAAASLILAKYRINQEAELAMELEGLASQCRVQGAGCRVQIVKKGDGFILDPRPVFKSMVKDLENNVAKEKIAYYFHSAIAKMIVEVGVILRKESRINAVVLSGGVFQNKLLLSLAQELLAKEKFKVITHKGLSASDSSLALGQAAVANFSLRKGTCITPCLVG